MSTEIPKERPEQMVLVDNLTEEHIEKWNRFCDLVNAALVDVFDGEAQVLIGLQFGGMGQDESLPQCIGTSNMPICQTRQAVDDLVTFYDAQHIEAHQNQINGLGGGDFISEVMSLDNVPDEIREKIEAMIAEMGGTMENVQFIEVADISDLAALPETESGEPEVAP